MRPKFLEIQGLQSFRKAVRIEFDPLGDTGLFGIFGPTGSGKSTVLDAITLALYGKVKRAERGTQGIINLNEEAARVSFTFELLKGQQRKVYRVERAYQRKKDSRNSCEPKVVRLIEITDTGEIPLCDKSGEVSRNIEALLGLSHEDFTRAVVLPQNSFQEFLMLDNAKKREMLERIFYLEAYGKQLNDKVIRKTSALKQQLDVLEGELRGYAEADDATLKKAEEERDEALSELTGLLNKFKEVDQEFNEKKDVWGLIQELEYTLQREVQHKAAEPDFLAKKVLYDRAIKADSLKDGIKKFRETTKKHKDAQCSLKTIEAALPEAKGRLDDTRTAYNVLQKEIEDMHPQLVARRTRLADALEQIRKVNALKKQIEEKQTELGQYGFEYASKDAQIKKEQAALDAGLIELSENREAFAQCQVDPAYRSEIQGALDLERELKRLKDQFKEARGSVTELERKVQELDQQAAEATGQAQGVQKQLNDKIEEQQKHGEAKPEERNTIQGLMDQLHKNFLTIELLKVKKRDINVLVQSQEQSFAAIGALREKLDGLKLASVECKAARNIRKAEAEEALRSLEANSAYHLAKNLKEGVPCPVCGSAEHPNPAYLHENHEDLVDLEQCAEDAKKALDEAEAALRDMENNVLRTGEQIDGASELYRRTDVSMLVMLEQFQSEMDTLPQEYAGLDPDEIAEKLEKMDGMYRQKLLNLEVWEKTGEILRQGKDELTLRLNQLHQEEKLISEKRKMSMEGLNKEQKTLNGTMQLLGERTAAYEEVLVYHQITNAEAEIKRLSENDTQAQLLKQKIDSQEKEMEALRGSISLGHEKLREINEYRIRIQGEIEGFVRQKVELETQIKDLAGDTDVLKEIENIDRMMGVYKTKTAEFKGVLQDLEQKYYEMVQQQTSLKETQWIYREQLEREEMQLKEGMCAKGFCDVDEVEKALISPKNQSEMETELKAYENKKHTIEANKESILAKLDGRTLNEEVWLQLCCTHEEVSAAKENAQTRGVLAKEGYAQLKLKNSRWKELTDLIRQQSHKHGLYSQIQSLLKGDRGKDNSFVDYIAEERLRYVAAKASETLGIMTQFKYALELDAEEGFIIRDNLNGGIHRMVGSLSGGETFLTSLSLALALSEQIQLKGQSPLEFFFLDEGFGTLDTQLLDTVMDALERLSSRDRVIGLISHVPEMKNRVSRRLLVTPPSMDGEGSKVCIERG